MDTSEHIKENPFLTYRNTEEFLTLEKEAVDCYKRIDNIFATIQTRCPTKEGYYYSMSMANKIGQFRLQHEKEN